MDAAIRRASGAKLNRADNRLRADGACARVNLVSTQEATMAKRVQVQQTKSRSDRKTDVQDLRPKALPDMRANLKR